MVTVNGPESSLEGCIFMSSWARKLTFKFLSPRVYIDRCGNIALVKLKNAGFRD